MPQLVVGPCPFSSEVYHQLHGRLVLTAVEPFRPTPDHGLEAEAVRSFKSNDTLFWRHISSSNSQTRLCGEWRNGLKRVQHWCFLDGNQPYQVIAVFSIFLRFRSRYALFDANGTRNVNIFLDSLRL